MKHPFDPAQAIRDTQHSGEEGGVVPVIDVGATSTFLDPETMERTFHGEATGCYLYSRHSNPTVAAFSKKLAAMEGMEAALGVASGMAAISCGVEQLMPDGGHVISSRTVYGGTYALFHNVFPNRGIQVTFADMETPEQIAALEKLITPKTRVLYVETMSNPLLTIANLPLLSSLAKKRGLKLVVDNTFAPTIVTPARFGADVVVYSCTKYISGASDLIAGAIVSDAAFINQLVDLNHGLVMLTGPVMDARLAHELYIRLDHLPIRMKAHSEVARALAEKLASERIPVIYPGLKSHPQYELLRELSNPGYGFGGMMAVDCGEPQKAMKLAARLQEEKFGLYAVSLGFSRTLMSCPSVSTSSEIPQEEQKKMHLSPGLLRLSIGLTGNSETLAERFLKCHREVIG